MLKGDIEGYIGNQLQIGGCRSYTLCDGWGRGTRCIDVNTGSGLQYTIVPDRGMDISLASFRGINLVFLSCNGETHPSYYESENFGWFHTFAGGLLTTCGLTHVGPPATDNDENYGLHGRYSAIPASKVADLSGWVGDSYHIVVRGVAEECRMFGNKLRLEREISSKIGESVIRIHDRITNFGSRKSTYAIIYHMNIGFPLLSEHSELIIDPETTVPRDNDAVNGLPDIRSFIKPQGEFNEQVFIHKMKQSDDSKVVVTLVNKNIGISLSIKFDPEQLPYVWQWKMMGKGEYVLGLEPSNVIAGSRNELKAAGLLPTLDPGESTVNDVEVEVKNIL
jgi:hypothetical protein